MIEENRRVLMIGLPQTGKTTFLAALWYAVNNAADVPGALQLKELCGEDRYLDEIRERWLRFQKMERTKAGAEQTVMMRLTSPGGVTGIDVSFPDLSGERFSQQWEDRGSWANYAVEANSSMGALLFIHAGNIEKPARIAYGNILADELGAEKPGESSAESAEMVEWSASMAPTQVKLVDILQILLESRDARSRYKLGVIFSAWDLVMSLGRTPDEYLADSMPLLKEYLAGQTEAFQSAVFGVSAQGGSVDSDKERNELLEASALREERAIVASGGSTEHDITLPLKWLMGYCDGTE